MSTVSAAGPLHLDVSRFFQLYAARANEHLSAAFLDVFDYFAKTVVLSADTIRDTLTPFLKAFLTIFTQPDFLVPEAHVAAFIGQNTLLANLAAMSPFRTTDAFLESVLAQPSNLVKVLTLYSARNAIELDRAALFAVRPELASLWYNFYCEIYKTGLARADVIANLDRHLRHHDSRMTLAAGLSVPYFGASYVDGTALDRLVKPFLNEVVRRQGALPWQNRPNPRKIAVASDYWYPSHSAYRICAAYVRELKGAYQLTLIHTTAAAAELDTSIFDEVLRLPVRDGLLDLDALLINDFQLVYFPDVGMTLSSVILANQRIAPIQLCGLGHSVSTWGAEIDYFISGADAELPENPERNYSERLVLLPGMGAIHDRPNYTPRNAVALPRGASVEVVINCPWSAHKIRAPFLATIRAILDRVRERGGPPVRLRIFPGVGISEHNAHLPFLGDLAAALGDGARLDVSHQLDYDQYMQTMEEGDLTLDSYHFAGCNSIADSLWLRKPTVAWAGDKWYNRIGPAMLRLVGLEEWIATNEAEYIEKAVALITHPDRRAEAVATLQSADLDATIFSTRHAPAFRRAVDYLIANHARLAKEGSRRAIEISETRN